MLLEAAAVALVIRGHGRRRHGGDFCFKVISLTFNLLPPTACDGRAYRSVASGHPHAGWNWDAMPGCVRIPS